MIKFSPEVSLSQLITMLTVAVGFVFTLGRITSKIDQMHETLKQLVEDFRDHKREDIQAFEHVREDITGLKLEVRLRR